MVVAPLLIDLGVLVTFLVAFALCLLAGLLVRALFGTIRGALGWVPWFGRVITAPVEQIEAKVVNTLARAATGLEARIGAVYHSAARIVEEIGHKIADSFELIYALTGVVASLATWKGVTALYHSLVGQEKATVSTVREHGKAIAKTQKVTQAQTKVVTQTVVRTQAIPADVVVPRDLAPLRARTRAIEDGYARVWSRIRSLTLTTPARVAAGAVALALTTLGLNWIRCNNWRRVGRSVCGLPHEIISALIGATVAAFSITELCLITKAARAALFYARPVIDVMIDGFEELMECQGSTRPPDLALREARWPTPANPLSL